MSAGTDWDVVVVGAGPAGSTAARVAAEAGSRVALLDKASFPRYKTCGGGLIGYSLASLPPQALNVVERKPTVVRVSRGGRQYLERVESEPIVAMVQRDRFDQRLVDLAIEAGAIFMPSTRVSHLTAEGEHVVVRAGSTAYTGAVVVGADGSGGRCGRFVGVEIAHTDLGLEVEIPTPDGQDQWEQSVYLDWGSPPGSYGWVFPKDGQLTVGVIQERGHAELTQKYLVEWLSYLGLEGEPVSRSSGHLTQWRSEGSPLRRGRVLMAGEGAGLLEPWTREGISFALRSGAMAGAAAAAAAATSDPSEVERVLTGYEAQVQSSLQPEIDAGRLLFEIFERRAGLVNQILTRWDRAARFFVRYCRGEKDFARSIPAPLLRTAHRVLA